MTRSNRDDDSTRSMSIDEDNLIKMKVKLLWAIIVATVVGTLYFATVMYKLDSLGTRQQQIENRINYLFKKLHIDNPFTGELNESTSYIPADSAPSNP